MVGTQHMVTSNGTPVIVTGVPRDAYAVAGREAAGGADVRIIVTEAPSRPHRRGERPHVHVCRWTPADMGEHIIRRHAA